MKEKARQAYEKLKGTASENLNKAKDTVKQGS